jgi:hypothetical protein
MLPVANTTPSYFPFFYGIRRNKRSKIGIAYTTLLLVIMTGYKLRITGNENNSNNLAKHP